MQKVFEDIRNTVVFKSDTFAPIRVCDILTFGGHIDTISSEDYTALGVRTEISANLLVHEEENKYYGKQFTRNYLFKAKDYQNLQYINIQGFLYDDIVGYEYINDELYYELQTTDTIDLMRINRNYRNLPRRKQYHFINIKTKVCSCDDFVLDQDCKHGRKLNIENFRMVLESKLGEIGKDICDMCE